MKDDCLGARPQSLFGKILLIRALSLMVRPILVQKTPPKTFFSVFCFTSENFKVVNIKILKYVYFFTSSFKYLYLQF